MDYAHHPRWEEDKPPVSFAQLFEQQMKSPKLEVEMLPENFQGVNPPGVDHMELQNYFNDYFAASDSDSTSDSDSSSALIDYILDFVPDSESESSSDSTTMQSLIDLLPTCCKCNCFGNFKRTWPKKTPTKDQKVKVKPMPTIHEEPETSTPVPHNRIYQSKSSGPQLTMKVPSL